MENLSKPRKLLPGTRRTARCSNSNTTESKISTAPTIANGFLKHSFLPKWEQAQEPIKNTKTVELDFFTSLFILTEKEGIEPMDVSGKCFPYNLILAHYDASRKLHKKNRLAGLQLMENEKGRITLAKREDYFTGSTLFYIPVAPLYHLFKDKSKRKSAELLLSVFSYLCRFAAVPYYRDDYSFLGWHYEMIEEWAKENIFDFEDENEYQQKITAIGRAKYIGDIIGRRIYSSYQLEHIDRRIKDFAPKNSFERECLRLARVASSLLKNYPDNNIFSHLPEVADTDEVVMADQFVSFVFKNKGSLYDEIAQMVNDDFGNKGDMQQPSAVTIYEGNGTSDNLSYEHQLFPLIEELITLLNELK